MKQILFAILVINTFICFDQIDYTKLIIGRNQGTHTFPDGEQTRIMGFTESLSAPTKVPGPTIIINSGDSIKIDFWNMSQGAPHTIHLHGLDVDQQNDGVGMLSFEVEHDQHGYYYFKAPHPGTYLYHCHVGSTVHLQAGMYGLVIVRPSNGNTLLNWDGGEYYNKEFALLTSEIDTVWHNDTILDQNHDMAMQMPYYVPQVFKPQYFLINGLSGPQLSDPANYLFALQNEKVYMRLANIGYYGTRFIFPSQLNARTVASDGRPLPFETFSDTVEVLPGERYEAFLQLGTDTFYPFVVEHFNLNTQIVESQQTMTIQTSLLNLEGNLSPTFNLHPNPSRDLFIFDGDITESYSVQQIDGRELFRSMSNLIDMSKYPTGIYCVLYKGQLKKIFLY
ncbi:MAG: multicopper oxidase domain-containing protein [Flavobacteriia bacterium]|jgi:FtsP/CotA-like multicopper oxidase with cupredoxin domain